MSPQLMRVTKELFFAVSSRNTQLDLQYVESRKNKADPPSRRFLQSDSNLSDDVVVMVDQAFGGSIGHSFDLMALDSNAMSGKNGLPLSHFSPFPSPCSEGVNLFCQDLRSARHNYVQSICFPSFWTYWPGTEVLGSFQDPIHDRCPRVRPSSLLVAGVHGSLRT